MMGVMGVNAIRERFREDDFVRFHPIINSGGDLVNVIPDYVTMESYTRAANVDALLRYNTDINRALRAGADAVGATWLASFLNQQGFPSSHRPICPPKKRPLPLL